MVKSLLLGFLSRTAVVYPQVAKNKTTVILQIGMCSDLVLGTVSVVSEEAAAFCPVWFQ